MWPLLPFAVVPVVNDSEPLTPDEPASPVRMLKEPLGGTAVARHQRHGAACDWQTCTCCHDDASTPVARSRTTASAHEDTDASTSTGVGFASSNTECTTASRVGGTCLETAVVACHTIQIPFLHLVLLKIYLQDATFRDVIASGK